MSRYESLFRPESPDNTIDFACDKNLTPVEKVDTFISWLEDINSNNNKWDIILKTAWITCYDFSNVDAWGENPSIAFCLTQMINDAKTINKMENENSWILYHFIQAMITEMLYQSLKTMNKQGKIPGNDNEFDRIIVKRDFYIETLQSGLPNE